MASPRSQGRGSAYRMLLAAGAKPEEDRFQDSIHYNGIKTIRDKTEFAKKNAAGIMIWQISQDTVGKLSLLRAISMEVK